MSKDGSLGFEKSLVELEKKIEELKSFTDDQRINLKDEIAQMEARAQKLREEIYSNLTPWQIVQISRHMQRPHTQEYIRGVFDEFREMHGDRAFIDDRAMAGGVAWMDGEPMVVIGIKKGKDTKENIECNFGLPIPEGYRKAGRLMKFAEKFNLPIVSFVDTQGAFPGLEGEERGVAEAIATNLRDMSVLKVPIVVVVIGEGGSGGALGIGVGDKILMLSYAYYSVITPEGCAAILWKDRAEAARAAEILKITAPDLKQLGVIDEIIEEPLGGAHHDPELMIQRVRQGIAGQLKALKKIPTDELLEKRYKKYMKIGYFDKIVQEDIQPATVSGSGDGRNSTVGKSDEKKTGGTD
ncbi:acetyl-CoA carboxylase carboxyltransferase subunit alpha [bacterium]|nr:acetyl-CoA carboxylase carboxyltransferase subunit alpha [bacterium]